LFSEICWSSFLRRIEFIKIMISNLCILCIIYLIRTCRTEKNLGLFVKYQGTEAEIREISWIEDWGREASSCRFLILILLFFVSTRLIKLFVFCMYCILNTLFWTFWHWIRLKLECILFHNDCLVQSSSRWASMRSSFKSDPWIIVLALVRRVSCVEIMSKDTKICKYSQYPISIHIISRIATTDFPSMMQNAKWALYNLRYTI
jgi:hypothetical protein